MSNRRNSAQPTAVRPALMHALDVEYARASKARNVARMAEISEIVRRLDRVFSEASAVEPAEAPELTLLPLATPEPPAATPTLYTLPGHSQAPFATNLKLTSLQAILTRAEDGPPVAIPPIRVPSTPQDWRQRAKTAVLRAINEVNSKLAAGRPLYEQALMARNRKVEPLAGLKLAASIEGISVEEKVDQIIAEYDAAGRRTMYIHALQAKAVQGIDNATTGDDADAIARQAVKDIMGEDE